MGVALDTVIQPFQAYIYHCHPYSLQARLVVDEDDLRLVKNYRKLPCIGKTASWTISRQITLVVGELNLF